MADHSKGTYFYVFLNSTILFIIANILETLLHEFGHYFTALAVGIPNVTIYHNYTLFDNSSVSELNRLLVSSAGPLVSLLIGIIFQWACKGRTKKDLVFMFQNYLSIFGYISFFGYLMVAPFISEGDTSLAFQILDFPLWLVISISVISMMFLYVIMFRLTRNFVLLSPYEALEINYARGRFMAILILYPLIVGVVATTMLNLPVAAALILVSPIVKPLIILFTYPQALKKNYRGVISNRDFDSINQFNYYPLIALFAVVILNRLLVLGF